MKHTKRIQKYLDGSLSESENKKFRKDLDMDPELRGEYQLHLLIDQTLEHHVEMRFRRKLNEVHQSQYRKDDRHIAHKPKEAQSSRTSFRKSLYFVLPAAVIFPAIFLFFSSKEVPTADEIFATYFTPYHQDLISRSYHKNDSANALIEGIYYYQKALYSQSKLRLSNYIEADSSNVTALFYLGLSQMAMSDFNDAVMNFNLVLNRGFNYYREHCQWYLGLCYLKLDQVPEARRNFQSLQQHNSVYAERATLILHFLPPSK
ncbi:MAG TPA: tetratricopeptide repeat protein [Bacteroidales bacterium]|nr:tetratricopeptide repeat protein [Bacteroidales bacterium]